MLAGPTDLGGLDGLGFGLAAPICGIETPRISGGRSIAHFILFLLCFYFGSIRRLEA